MMKKPFFFTMVMANVLIVLYHLYLQRFQRREIGNGRSYCSTQTAGAHIPRKRKCSLLDLNIRI